MSTILSVAKKLYDDRDRVPEGEILKVISQRLRDGGYGQLKYFEVGDRIYAPTSAIADVLGITPISLSGVRLYLHEKNPQLKWLDDLFLRRSAFKKIYKGEIPFNSRCFFSIYDVLILIYCKMSHDDQEALYDKTQELIKPKSDSQTMPTIQYPSVKDAESVYFFFDWLDQLAEHGKLDLIDGRELVEEFEAIAPIWRSVVAFPIVFCPKS